MLFLRLFKESFLSAVNSLVSNLVRALLSLFGVTIGILVIIGVFTVFDSIDKTIKDGIASLGQDVVYVAKMSWEFGQGYKWWKYINRPVPKLKELDEIMARTNNVEVGAFTVITVKPIQYKKNSIDGSTVYAVTHDYDQLRSFELERGRYFTQFESKGGRNVIILGYNIAENLFKGKEPVGKTVKVGEQKAMVIGVFAKEGEDALTNVSIDNTVLIPVNFARNFIDIRNDRSNPMIMLKPKEGVSAIDLSEELTGVMRAIRRLKPRAEDNFALNRTSMLSKSFDNIFVVAKIVGGFVGAFAILVGVFGIANIMFVSVKERTRQIGIEKSLGAKRYFILFQFLFESVILSLFGGVIGLILVYVLAKVGSGLADMEFSMSLGNILTGIILSSMAGIISGIIPAYRASRLDPVVAMNSNF